MTTITTQRLSLAERLQTIEKMLILWPEGFGLHDLARANGWTHAQCRKALTAAKLRGLCDVVKLSNLGVLWMRPKAAVEARARRDEKTRARTAAYLHNYHARQVQIEAESSDNYERRVIYAAAGTVPPPKTRAMRWIFDAGAA